jgi:polysaccharide export outer membrane protein
MVRSRIVACTLLIAGGLWAQDAQALLQGLRAAQGAGNIGGADAVPGRPAGNLMNPVEPASTNPLEEAQLEQQIRELKIREAGPKRFASDLFEVRQRGRSATDGGVSDDYVLGTGDQLGINAFGSASFEVPVQVDGRGMVIIPKLGSLKVGGMSLGKAREAIQSKVRSQFSNTSVEVQALKLREVRIFLMGEVYKPGSYVVPSLSSLVNVLSLAGGPNALGSYRQIRILRGGKVVHTLDLYPFRAEGLGNINFYLENGDTLFVPLAQNLVLLEGAFTRLVAAAQSEAALGASDRLPGETRAERSVRRQIEELESTLGITSASGSSTQMDPASLAGSSNSTLSTLARSGGALNPMADARDKAKSLAGLSASMAETGAGTPVLTPQERMAMATRLDALKDRLATMKLRPRSDLRIKDPEADQDEFMGQPLWFTRWERDGEAPAMQFEMLPGETATEALKYAGGFDVQAFAGRLALRRMNESGAWNTLDVSLEAGRSALELRRGDVLTALPRRDRTENVVQIAGWVRSPGVFARKEGLRVGDLLRRENELLPDSYMARGEITRIRLDGTTQYLAFDITKAMAGDAEHNVLLEDRDRVELYRVDDLRIRKTLNIVGPVKRPGTYEFHEGMRAADLIFRAGIPARDADRLVAELTHYRDGKQFQVIRLDLQRLLSTEATSPVQLKDDAVNPFLEPFDLLSVYSKPDYKPSRTIRLSGQVKRPGVYTLETSQTSLKEVVARAGGLTEESMPKAAIFLRKMWQASPEMADASAEAGVGAEDPTSNGINEILMRLNETLRNPLLGSLQKSPILHGLQSGSLNRLIVDIPALLADQSGLSLELQDGDEVIFPSKTEAAYIVGETASPFAVYKVEPGMTVKDMIKRAGGPTRNADKSAIRLLKADGRIVDTWVSYRKVEPGDAVLVPQRIRKDVTWQENLAALTPLAILINAFK